MKPKMARFTSIYVTIVLAAIFMCPTTGRENQQKRYLLVQISETMKGKPRQILPVAGENSYKPQYKTVDSYVYDGVKAIANKALDAFDSLNKNNVPLPNIPPPNLGSLGGGSNTGTNTGNSGNSG